MRMARLHGKVRVLTSYLLLFAVLAAWGSRAKAQSSTERSAAIAGPVEGEKARMSAGLKTPPRAREVSAYTPRGRPTGPLAASPGAPAPPSPSREVDWKLRRRRDPFRLPPPPSAGVSGIGVRHVRLPGKQGLVIGQLRLEGIVREQSPNVRNAPDGMIAVVTNSTHIAYFLREYDTVYDGRVTKITGDAIHFEQEYLDPEGQTKRREVVLQLNAASAEEP
jgi:hypothetical protein